MKCNRAVLIDALALFALQAPILSLTAQDKKSLPSASDSIRPVEASRLHNPVLWRDPVSISTLDLYLGQGGVEGQPVAPFKFQAEDRHGTNPKFDVRDSQGTQWRVKLGDEARPEVVASRLLWAVGYFVNDDYVVPSAQVEGLHLDRGSKLASGGHIRDARFEKKPDHQKKIGIWCWKQNPFTGTKEFNGLRAMMALMNNWDLKDVNNAVYRDEASGKDLFLTSDIGATFGTNGLSWSKRRSKGDVGTFAKSEFITDKTATTVSFGTPAAPALIEAPNVEQYEMRRDLRWIGEKIPIADARWIGSILKQLSHRQIEDAFRAGHFPPEETEKYVVILEERINELAAL